MLDFVGFQKIARFARDVIVSEKIDGTNAQILIGPEGEFLTGSRSRWITISDDNHGFSRWAHEHRDELLKLGPGRHFGEWWGSGINRGYDLPAGEKRFSLFNVQRWCLFGTEPQPIPTNNPKETRMQEALPACVGLVPVLWTGNFEHINVERILGRLIDRGSVAAPGFMQPEGIVIWHVAGNVGFKKTIERDDVPKGTVNACQ